MSQLGQSLRSFSASGPISVRCWSIATIQGKSSLVREVPQGDVSQAEGRMKQTIIVVQYANALARLSCREMTKGKRRAYVRRR